MNAEERANLESRGYKLMDYAEFLGLSPEEQVIIEMRLALAQNLREQRLSQGMPQSAVATKVNTTQKRVSLMESADKSISLDRLFAANIALGITPANLLRRLSESLTEPYTDHASRSKASSKKHLVKQDRKPVA